MPTYKDNNTGKWYVKCYYTDYTGTKKQKMKRGFTLQREAKEWERAFMEQQAAGPGMTLQTLYNLYMEDMGHRLKETTLYTKRMLVEVRLLPALGQKPIDAITPADVRTWQNSLIAAGYKETTLRAYHKEFNALLNYAVKFYGLKTNPCAVTGSIGRAKADRMEFWTHDEFKQFIAVVDNPMHYALFNVLYYAGLRWGEALALTPADIDLQKQAISITKTFHRRGGQDIITAPKTVNSIRSVPIPAFLCDTLWDYMDRIYGLRHDDRVFPIVNARKAMSKYCSWAGVKKIRIHDLRHSHVSLLIDLGFSAMLIADRIGDTVSMVNEVYGHLYPNRQTEVADRLQNLVSK